MDEATVHFIEKACFVLVRALENGMYLVSVHLMRIPAMVTLWSVGRAQELISILLFLLFPRLHLFAVTGISRALKASAISPERSI